MSSRRIVAAVVAAVLTLALALSGCGLGNGPHDDAAATTTATPDMQAPSPSAITRAQTAHELPTPAPGSASRVSGGWHTPRDAVTAFATTYVNWTAPTVAAQLRNLSQASVGQARAVTARAAAEVARDRELHEGGVANSGTVESVAPVRGRPNAYAVVTRERTRAAHDAAYRGVAPAWHVSVATVTRLTDGLWVLSGWQPES